MTADIENAEEIEGAALKTVEDTRQLIKLADRIVRRFDEALKRSEQELSATQWALLDSLQGEGAVRPFTLASKLSISRQHGAQIIKKLTEAGLVEVSKSNEAERAVFVSLTDKGKDAISAIDVSLQSIADALNEEMPKLRTYKTKRVLKAISHALKPAPTAQDIESETESV